MNTNWWDFLKSVEDAVGGRLSGDAERQCWIAWSSGCYTPGQFASIWLSGDWRIK